MAATTAGSPTATPTGSPRKTLADFFKSKPSPTPGGSATTETIAKTAPAPGGGNGMVWVNTYKRVSPGTPFGGVGMSGYGRDLGPEAIHEYTDAKSVFMTFTGPRLLTVFVQFVLLRSLPTWVAMSWNIVT